jgi:tetratricopeptide (TPR) repeat protein
LHSAALFATLLFFVPLARPADDDSAMRDAAAAMQRGDFPAAERSLRAELQKRPDDGLVLSLLGLTLDNLKQSKEAEDAFRRAVANAPRSPDVQSNYGIHLLSTGDENGAREAFLKAIAADPAHYAANVQLARLALERKNGADALTCLRRLPANQQDAPSVAILKLEALYLAGDKPEADALVQRLSAPAENDPRLSFALGMALSDAGHPDQAEPFLTRALAAAPADFGVLYALGVTALHAGHFERARDVLQTALRQQPQDVDALYSLAIADRALNQKEDAVRLLAQAAQLAPQRADVQKLMALVTGEVGAVPDSLAAWDRYMQLEPADDLARSERGLQFVAGGKTEQGLADLKWYVAKHPDDAEGYYNLGLGEAGLDLDQGIKDLGKALALKPDFAGAHAARGSLYYQQGSPDAALKDLEFAAAHQPAAGVLDKLGQTYLALNRPADAVGALRKAAAMRPDDSAILLHFGRALGDAGQTEESKAVLDRFRQLGPPRRTVLPAGVVDYLGMSPEQQRADYRARVEQAVAKDPTDAAAEASYLQLSLDDGDLEHASAAARRIASLKPGAAALAAAGRMLLAAKQYALAQELLEQAAAAGPFTGVALDQAVAAFHISGPAQGLSQMDRVPESERGGDYYLARAYMLDASGKSEESLAALNQALGASSGSSDLYREAAALLLWNGHASEALRVLDRAAQTLPQDREIALMQATALELAGKSADASHRLSELQNRWPEWHAVWVASGVILAAHRDFEGARQALETAFVLGAHSPEAWFYLADASLGCVPRRMDAAEKAIAQAVKLAPGDARIQSLAARIAAEKNGGAAAQPDPSTAGADLPYMKKLFLEEPPQSW